VRDADIETNVGYDFKVESNQDEWLLTVAGYADLLVFLDAEAIHAFIWAIASDSLGWLRRMIQEGWIFNNGHILDDFADSYPRSKPPGPSMIDRNFTRSIATYQCPT
jgi:hypothetical protein